MELIGQEIYDFTSKCFPLNRYLMGDGVRKTFQYIKEILPELSVYEVPSGTKAFDWTVPDEWVIRDAFIENTSGKKIVDFRENNLHVMAYSEPVNAWLSKEELAKFVFWDEGNPDAIPYVASYYMPRIGMCMSKRQWDMLDDDKYHICIDCEKVKGSLTYGEIVYQGEMEDEILFHSVVCHPSLANDELSGVTLATYLAREVGRMQKRRFTYRFVFAPETIGAIVYISSHLAQLKMNVKAGYILSCEGDNGAYSYLPSITGQTLADRAACAVLNSLHPNYKSYSFLERGSDERQYNAPGIDIPVCLVCRSKAGTFPEYHTSSDNMNFVSPEGFAGSFDVFTDIIKLLEHNQRYKTAVMCEPHLTRYGLYSDLTKSGNKNPFKRVVDFLAYADGTRDLIEIMDILKMDVHEACDIIRKLSTHHLITIVRDSHD